MKRAALLPFLVLVACGDDPAATGSASSGGGDGATGSPSVQAAGGGAAESGSGGADGEGGEGGDGASVVSTTTSATASSASSGTGGEGPIDDCPRVRVTVPDGQSLNVRPDPSTANDPVGTLQDGAIVEVVAEVEGEAIDGNAVWYEITTPALTGFIFSGFAVCTQDPVPEPPDGFYLPLECGTSATVTQGNNSGFSHDGDSAYAFDFSLGVGTPMVAMADGVVAFTYAGTLPGDPCYDGGGPSCIAEANYVVVRHADATQTQYAHLSEVLVEVGQTVARGAILGLSGSTGYSTGPHAHVQRDDDCGFAFCGSIPLEFVDAGVPVTGDVVTSMNCPE